MTDGDLGGFMETYRSLQSVLIHARLSEEEARDQASAYFHALRKYPLRDLRAAADRLMASSTKFPKPAEWIGALPKREAADVRQMTQAEASEFHRAQYAAEPWQADPCGCAACQAAGVTHRYLRFVPTVDDDGRPEQAVDPTTGHVEAVGHWAHGWELARYYAARDRFCDQLQKAFGPRAALITAGTPIVADVDSEK